MDYYPDDAGINMAIDRGLARVGYHLDVHCTTVGRVGAAAVALFVAPHLPRASMSTSRPPILPFFTPGTGDLDDGHWACYRWDSAPWQCMELRCRPCPQRSVWAQPDAAAINRIKGRGSSWLVCSARERD